jgi:hypothetical protein
VIDIQVAPLVTPPPHLLPAATPSGWQGLELILGPLLERYRVPRRTALEFGVEHGYSTVILSNYFLTVLGVDHFAGDEHAGLTPPGVDRYRDTAAALRAYPNIRLLPSSWQDFIHEAASRIRFDLIHVDAKHDFYTTYVLGTWAVQHSSCVLFHDTCSFPPVALACDRIVADDPTLTAYNWPGSNGLGILVREAKQ